MQVVQTKTIIKFLVWAAALTAVSFGIVYAFWSLLIGMLYDDQLHMLISGTIGLILFGMYWKILSLV